jgi:NAD(P)-dependent dehydrogenase (short-subunit alcohol dehydrogenase family)
MDKLFVVVTGCSSGLGSALSKLLIDLGRYSVIGLDINESDFVDENYHFISSDLSDRKTIEDLVNNVIEISGKSLYGIVNVAGISVGKSIVGMDENDWDKMLQVNLTSPALLISKLQDIMVEGGRIVNVSSPVSVTGSNKPGYSASKAGMHGLTMSVAKNLGPRNILVNTVFPGPMITGMTQKWSQDKRDSIATESFLGRLTTSEEVANGIKFLLNPETTGITGSILDFTAGSMFTH